MTTVVVVSKTADRHRLRCAGDLRRDPPAARLRGQREDLPHRRRSHIGLAGQHRALRGHAPRRWRVARRRLQARSRHEVFDDLPAGARGAEGAVLPEPKEDEADPYESSQITALIANPSGIYGVYSYREVFSFDRSGASAPAATSRSVRCTRPTNASTRRCEIAEIGVRAGCEFDKSSALPLRVFSVPIAPGATA